MKINPTLPNYVISNDGIVFHKSTGVEVDKVNGLYKLQTDESVVCETKRKTIKLVRRLSPKDIMSLYNRPESKPVTDDKPKEVVKVKEQKKKAVKADTSKHSGLGVMIEQVEYKSASDAAKALGVAVNTIINRCKADKFENYKFI